MRLCISNQWDEEITRNVSNKECTHTSKKKKNYDGTWPLGLSDEVVREYNIVRGIEEFENQKQKELKQRWVNNEIVVEDEQIFETSQ